METAGSFSSISSPRSRALFTWLDLETEPQVDLLLKQFGVTEDSVKGTGQLARVVNALASQQWTGPEGSFAGVRTIYPVLVVHDRGSAAPGFGTFIDAEFRRALLPHDSPGPCPP